jgi:hypothetical protein
VCVDRAAADVGGDGGGGISREFLVATTPYVEQDWWDWWDRWHVWGSVTVLKKESGSVSWRQLVPRPAPNSGTV